MTTAVVETPSAVHFKTMIPETPKPTTRVGEIKGREASTLARDGKAFTVIHAMFSSHRDFGSQLSLRIQHEGQERVIHVPDVPGRHEMYQNLVRTAQTTHVEGVRLARFKLPGGGTFFGLAAVD